MKALYHGAGLKKAAHTCSLLLALLFIPLSLCWAQPNFIATGDATQINDFKYRMTEDLTYEEGAIWSDEPIDLDEPFEIEFCADFGDADATGADGIAFVFQNESDPNVTPPLGSHGGGIGYAKHSEYFTDFIDFSVAIEFDTYYNLPADGTIDPSGGADHIDVFGNGDRISGGTTLSLIGGPVQADPANANIEDGNCHKIRIVWEPDNTTPANSTLKVYFDGNERVNTQMNIRDYVNNPNETEAWWGITSATGDSHNEQTVLFLTADFSTQLTGCDQVTFTSEYTETGVTHEWDFGDGNISSDADPTHSYSMNGEFTVTHTVTDPCGCSFTTESVVNIACCRHCGPNLVLNHDFSAANCGQNYLSDLTLLTPCPGQDNTNTATLPNQHGESTGVNGWNSNAWSGTDHTGNGSKLFFIDAPTDATKRAWYQTVQVVEGKEYCFSVWIRNACPPCTGADADLRLMVGGLSGTLVAREASVTETSWTELCGTYTATQTGSVELDIVIAQAAAQGGYDVLVDDIYFGTNCDIEDCCERAKVEVTDATVNPFLGAPCAKVITAYIEGADDCELASMVISPQSPGVFWSYDPNTNSYSITVPGYSNVSTLYTVYFMSTGGEVICVKNVIVDCELDCCDFFQVNVNEFWGGQGTCCFNIDINSIPLSGHELCNVHKVTVSDAFSTFMTVDNGPNPISFPSVGNPGYFIGGACVGSSSLPYVITVTLWGQNNQVRCTKQYSIDCINNKHYSGQTHENINETDNGFQFYPNPTTGMVNIQYLDHATSTDERIYVEIVNTGGQLVFSQTALTVNQNHQLDLTGLAEGLYFLKVRYGQEVKVYDLFIGK